MTTTVSLRRVIVCGPSVRARLTTSESRFLASARFQVIALPPIQLDTLAILPRLENPGKFRMQSPPDPGLCMITQRIVSEVPPAEPCDHEQPSRHFGYNRLYQK